MADLSGQPREKGVEERDGQVVSFTSDEPVTDPESDLAVQIPDGVDGSDDNPLAVHAEPSPAEVFGGGEVDQTKPAGKEAQKDDEHQGPARRKRSASAD